MFLQRLVGIPALVVTLGLALAASAQPAPVVPEEPAGAAAAPAGVQPDTAPVPDTVPAVAPASDGMTDKERQAQQVKLREMEERVVGMKEKIYAAKTRLVLLKEKILSNVVDEAWAIIVHENDIGSAFTLDQVMYYMDGKKKFFMRNKDGILDTQRTIEIFSGSVVPGNHTITVEMIFNGTGKIFTYLDGYKFKITSKYTFYASQGRIMKIQAVGYEKGDFTYSLEDRPAVKFKVSQYQFNKENLSKLTSGETKGEE
jgi:hypothetical protein